MKFRIFGAALLTFVSFSTIRAQTPAVFASGLQTPSRIIVGPNGTLVVTEVGSATNSGRISILDAGGNRRTLLDGLPSGPSAPNGELDGPNGLALAGRVLYIAIGEGDSHINGPKQGTILPNPTGSSSPMFSTLLAVTFSNDLDKIATGFSLQSANQFTLMDGIAVNLSNTTGDTASVKVLTAFRIDRPDPASIVRNTHLYGLTLLPAQPNTIYVDDAGNNAVWQVDLTSGSSKLLVRFPNVPDSLAPAGPPTSEAVPTSVHPYGDQLLVTLLTGAPFVPGASQVMHVDPTTGQSDLFMSLLASSIDLSYRLRQNGAGQWFVLEYSLGSLSSPTLAPGRLLVYNNPVPQVLADGLKTPVSMALDPATNNLYILDQGDGTVLSVNVGN